MTISPAELAARLKTSPSLRLLDVREAEEFAFCSLPGSRLLPLSELAERATELEDWKDQEIIVYCHHGVRSAHAIGLLTKLGFLQLLNLAGGIDRWSREIDPTVRRY